MRFRRSSAVPWLLCFSLVLLASCSSTPSGPNPAEENIRQVAVLCGKYVQTHKGSLPKNLEELKKFAKTNKDGGPPVADAIFISPRDNQPYVLVTRSKLPPPGGEKKTMIVHEKDGVGGQRYVAYELGQVEQVNEAKFQELLSSQK